MTQRELDSASGAVGGASRRSDSQAAVLRPEFYALENELLWPRVWQMACRLEEIPKPGDYVEYEILDESIIVVRVDADTVRAYHNACRHRGVKLVEGNGNRRTFVCPFHGWCWGIDGRNTFVLRPEEFDEHNLDPDDLRLVVGSV